MFPAGRLFKKQGSSKPLGAWIDALSDLISASDILPGRDTSLQDPTDIWLRFLPSPVIFALNGEPAGKNE